MVGMHDWRMKMYPQIVSSAVPGRVPKIPPVSDLSTADTEPT